MLPARNTVMVFGVFDGLDEGHRFFLNEAKKLGQLIIVVARDAAVEHLKRKSPLFNEHERMAAVQNFLPEATVVLGDEEQGSYGVIKTYRPDLVVLGYDQRALREDLERARAAGVHNFAVVIVERRV